MLFRMMLLASVFAGTMARAQDAPPPATSTPGSEQEGVIDPKADAALHRMSNYLGSLKSFRVETRTVDENITTDGQKIQEIRESKIAVKRPGELRVDRVGPKGHAVLRDDGKQFSVYNSDRHVYAMGPAPAQLDAAIDEARDRLHVDAPGGDPAGELSVRGPRRRAQGRALCRGSEPVGSVMAHHLAMTKGNVDYQIWIQDGPQAVPLRYVITSKDMPGQPQFTIDLRNWQPNAAISDKDFAFAPPKNANRIEKHHPENRQALERKTRP